MSADPSQTGPEIDGQLDLLDELPRPATPLGLLGYRTMTLDLPDRQHQISDATGWMHTCLPSETENARAGHTTGVPVRSCCRSCGYVDDPWRLRVYHLAPCAPTLR